MCIGRMARKVGSEDEVRPVGRAEAARAQEARAALAAAAADRNAGGRHPGHAAQGGATLTTAGPAGQWLTPATRPLKCWELFLLLGVALLAWENQSRAWHVVYLNDCNYRFPRKGKGSKNKNKDKDSRLRKHWVPIAGAGALLAVVVVIAVTVKGAAGTANDGRGLQGSTPTTSDAPEVSAPNSPPSLRSQAPAPADTQASTTEKAVSVVTSTTTAPFTGAAQRKLFQFVENLDDTVAVRTSNGGYISVSDGDNLGTAPAIGKHESFKLIDHPDGTISLESWAGSFIAAKGDEVKLAKKKGKFEKLKKIEQEDGAVMLETADGEHVSSEAFSDERGRFAVYAREAEEAGDAEKFHVEVNSDHTASLKSLHGTRAAARQGRSLGGTLARLCAPLSVRHCLECLRCGLACRGASPPPGQDRPCILSLPDHGCESVKRMFPACCMTCSCGL
ncbi:unnamed protein product [Prorocentrum cordatum]|uniref:Uncharacterized protein n=1 Tax=Prorocentrum cordatum TaxID=2364126 RepID=A0ABN9RYK7_9DINO|nr:unnamed protein product [Polarella glacialis]